MCHKIINGRSCIPSSTFSQHPYPSLRHSHSILLFAPQTHSVSHRFSFFISVVPLWNPLPLTIPFTSSAVTFKSHVVAYMYQFCLLYLLFFCFGGSTWISIYFAFGIPICLTLSCIKICIKKRKNSAKPKPYLLACTSVSFIELCYVHKTQILLLGNRLYTLYVILLCQGKK